jgi:hypothetical protein
MHRNLRIAALVLVPVLVAGAASAAGTRPSPGVGPADVVLAFNKALTARKLDDATALFAKGAVQYTLRAAHAGVTTGDGGVTSDLKTHWNTIGPVLFAVTSTYQRVPTVTDTRVDGDLATVWTTVASETVERSGKRRQDNFSEVYLLVRTGGAWRIGAIADNRGTDSMTVGAPGPTP